MVLAEISNGFEIGRELARQPDQFEIALALALQAAARRDAVEIAVNIEFEHHRRMVTGPAGLQRGDVGEAQRLEIEPINEGVDRADRVVLAHVVVERRWKQRALAAFNPFDKPSHPTPRFGGLILA